ncbi:7-cyano-7-deazaguanine synthase QueC [Synechococcus sp. PCC 7336]|uniref:7-cyano-7-deazaguanine synthase QueC n=1 Tax=Synechococcus sp. PCC 7336 TaxID=195250 RepID=UPI00034C47BE|nr:7-cyano-7-deazaguanine synthase QueC [Synechococcus sp. PCC 7336]
MSVKAVVLFSGGLDSTTVLYRAIADGCDCYPLSFDYQQRHRRELEAARTIIQALNRSRSHTIPHQVMEFSLRQWGGSALTDNLDLPKGRSPAAMAERIPPTYVPARNTIFLSFALSYAEAIGAERVYAGMNALDYSGYPDCRPDYIEAMQSVFNLGTKQGREGNPISIHTPLIELKKTEIIELGDRLGVLWELTWSCYAGGSAACGECDSCLLRRAAFENLGRTDPIPYAIPI